MTEVATMATVQEKVKERIRASFLDLIPPELWEGMVQAELHNFTKNELPKIIHEEASLKLREALKTEFKKPEWMGQWDNFGEKPSQFAAQVVREAAPELVNAMFGRIAQSIVNDLRNGNRY